MVSPEVLEAFRVADDRQWAEWQRKQDSAREAFLRLPEAERQARILDTLRRWEEFWEKSRREIEEEKRSPRAISRPPSPPMVTPVCSFCDRPRREVATMISGPRVIICDSCVAEAAGAMAHLLRA